MSLVTKPAPSFRWKLSWQLSLVFLAVVAVVIAGLCIWGALVLSPNVGMKDRLRHALSESISVDQQGRLIINETDELRSFKSENDRLWLVAVTRGGSIASYGVVPEEYEAIIPLTRLIRSADIRGAVGATQSASIYSINTAFGEIRVLYGGNVSTTDNIIKILRSISPIFVPLVSIAMTAMFFAIPRIVNSALAGLNNVVEMAPEIDPRKPGNQLPVENVPREVVPLIITFNCILTRLEEQFQSQQRFLINAAHEIRTPIAIMQTRIEGVAEERERIRLMADVARLREAAEQLLDFERNDQATEINDTVDIVDIGRLVVADMAPMAIAAGYDISFASDASEVMRNGNREALQRAISNLVRNAIEHGGNHGLISVFVSALGEIAVSDEGPGIPKDKSEQVFEPFYRLTPRRTGAGLGLSLVRQIVANHGGHVTIDSASSGTVFKIQL